MDFWPAGKLGLMRSFVQLVSASEPEGAPSSSVTTRAPIATRVEAELPFEELYEAHVDFVWRNAARLGVDEGTVDDVVQQVFLVVHRRLAERPREAPIKAWIFGILTHVVRDYRRSLRRKSPHSLMPPIDPESLVDAPGRGPFDALARTEAERLVHRLLDDLSDEKREIFLLAELEQLTAVEISEMLGVNASTVYSRLRAARQDFERAVQRYRSRDAWRLR